MNKTKKVPVVIACVLAFVLATLLSSFLGAFPIASAAGMHKPVTITDSTTTFRHFDYVLGDDHGFVSGDPDKIVSTVFNTKVVANCNNKLNTYD